MQRSKPGDVFEFFEGEEGLHEVLRVTSCSATVRPLRRERRVIHAVDGSIQAEFEAPLRGLQVSPNAMVRLVPAVEGCGARKGARGRSSEEEP